MGRDRGKGSGEWFERAGWGQRGLDQGGVR